MVFVYAGNDDGVHLGGNAARLEFFESFKLFADEQFSGLDVAVLFFLVADPCVDFSADCGVYGVDGNGDMANLQFGKFINIGEQVEAVDCHAEQHSGYSLRTRCRVSIVSSGLAKGSPGPAMPTTEMLGESSTAPFR